MKVWDMARWFKSPTREGFYVKREVYVLICQKCKATLYEWEAEDHKCSKS